MIVHNNNITDITIPSGTNVEYMHALLPTIILLTELYVFVNFISKIGTPLALPGHANNLKYTHNHYQMIFNF